MMKNINNYAFKLFFGILLLFYICVKEHKASMVICILQADNNFTRQISSHLKDYFLFDVKYKLKKITEKNSNVHQSIVIFKI